MAEKFRAKKSPAPEGKYESKMVGYLMASGNKDHKKKSYERLRKTKNDREWLESHKKEPISDYEDSRLEKSAISAGGQSKRYL